MSNVGHGIIKKAPPASTRWGKDGNNPSRRSNEQEKLAPLPQRSVH
jgi:hypothetical protein